MIKLREDGRSFNELRPIKLQYDALGYADASVLLEMGKTKVLAAITLQDGVPPFLRGQKTGWLTAEYAMLPCATHKRTRRDATQQQRSSRSIEISRLIGRSLRPVIDLAPLGEKTIMIDCDVLQADGGTRVASITAASLALDLAIKRWINEKILQENILRELVAGISVGLVNGNLTLDLSYSEDSIADSDFNFILTQSGNLIEVQGTAEKNPISWQNFEELKDIASQGIKQIFKTCNQFSQNLDTQKKLISKNISDGAKLDKSQKTPFFSIGNRIEKIST
jgi:ribonuclease PH